LCVVYDSYSSCKVSQSRPLPIIFIHVPYTVDTNIRAVPVYPI
jgi:hypothetical protein